MATITQRELNERIRQHEEWLKNEAKGNSPSFAGLDLSGLDFYGEKPFAHPVRVSGAVRNMADALLLEGTAETTLELACDRCGREFSREKIVRLESLVAQQLEDEENDEIILLDGWELDLDQVVTETFVLAMDTKNLCSDDCKGLCPQCGANLNEGPCGCSRDEADVEASPFAALKNFDFGDK